MSAPVLGDRSSGVLLHPTSLPGAAFNGDLGAAAHAFVDLLASAGQRWWQTLPIGPPGYGNSPYSAESAFAGSPLLISLESLVEDGLLASGDLDGAAANARGDRVDYGAAWAYRDERLRKAFHAFEERRKASPEEDEAFRAFCRTNEGWLDDFAIFRALKREHGQSAWTAWEPAVRDRRPAAMKAARARLAGEIAYQCFLQHVFDRQWQRLKDHAAASGIGLIGDVPIFVAHDSADVWQHRKQFRLDDAGQPTVVAGVPPDYFSPTGQRWGNPLYRWKTMAGDGFAWWIARLERTLCRFDVLRLDHFIGFTRYWEIDASEPTAEKGRWLKGPGVAFFEAVAARLGDLPLIAEDLGLVTEAVSALRDGLDLPGIRLLQFAFGTDPQAPSFLPHNHVARAVVYTGTHDNDTTCGWFHDIGGPGSTRTPQQTETERRAALAYLASDGYEIHWDMIRMALLSVAATALFPAQDLLGLGTEARMNRPGIASGNWEWRLADGALTPEITGRLRHLTTIYGRSLAEKEVLK